MNDRGTSERKCRFLKTFPEHFNCNRGLTGHGMSILQTKAIVHLYLFNISISRDF